MSLQNKIKRCAGRFRISRLIMLAYPETIMELMGKMLVLRCEHLAISDEFEYQALSTLFDETSMGQAMPEYEIYFNPTGRPKIFADRIDEGRTIH